MKTVKRLGALLPEPKSMNVPFFAKHGIPIYYAELWIGLLPDDTFVASTQDACKKILGYDYTHDEVNSRSLLAYRGSKFLLAFHENDKSIEVIAHEVFHLTHRILELCTCNFDAGHHEQGAYLNGWLMELITHALSAPIKIFTSK